MKFLKVLKDQRLNLEGSLELKGKRRKRSLQASRMHQIEKDKNQTVFWKKKMAQFFYKDM